MSDWKEDVDWFVVAVAFTISVVALCADAVEIAKAVWG